MKRNLLFILMALVSLTGTQIAVNAQELSVSDVQDSGCQRGTRSRANENETVRTIVLTKEGTVLTVQILGFVSNCATEGFDITPSMSGGSDGEPVSVSLGVEPIEPDVASICICPFNVSFTLHGLETNSFYFTCWWYEGQVNLTEGEPLMLESITEPVKIDEWYCTIDKVNHTAKLEGMNGATSYLLIPSELYYEEQQYIVTGIGERFFLNNQALTSVTLPPNLTRIGYYAFAYCSNLTDIYCYAENVPTTESDVFKETPIAFATLHVPAGSVDKYKATAPWSGFGNIVAIEEPAQEYFPEGTKWTEIRLDTLLYDSWYSKVGDEWVPNFETIEYYVKGDYLDRYEETPYKCVYSNGPEWADSLTLMILEDKYHTIAVTVPLFEKDNWGSFLHVLPGTAYQFDWNVGKGLYYRDIMESNSTGEYPYYLYYGVIDEIKEGDFGGVRPLKYVDLNGKAPYDPQNPGNTDTNGGRIIQGIGITEWNDGECLFGPPNPYFALTWSSGDRHYRSMLVHFERGGEVLYDVWPEKETATAVTYTKDQMATIILPTAPDAGKGKYYRLDRREDGKIIFEQEKQPQAHIPYIIIPNEDFSIDPGTLDLAGLHPDTVSIGGIDFIGSYSREEPVCREGWYIDIIDTTPDCGFATLGETGKGAFIGALRAYLTVNWDDPINHEGTKGPGEKMDVVLHDYGTNIASPLGETGVGASIYDLSGRRINSQLKKGIYIRNGRKVIEK